MGSLKVVWVVVTLGAFCVAEGYAKGKFIDLTHAFNKDTVTFPGRTPTFNVEFEGFTHGVWVASKGFCTSEHTATHIDAPYHFHKEGATLDKIPLEDLIDQPGVVIDIYDKVNRVVKGELKVIENYVLSREDIIEWEAKNGRIPQRSIVLVHTGWGSRWPDKKLFRGSKNATDGDEEFVIGAPLDLNYPGFDASAAQFLAVERSVLGVGIDTLSIDAGSSATFPAHQIFAARSIWMLEMVANLHLLPPNGFNLWVVPFKIDMGTGAPTRVLAKLNTHD